MSKICLSLHLKLANLCEVHMKGIQHIEVSNRDAKYKFDLYRNITIVRGKSGTGKTTLFDMIVDYTRLKDKSGVNISSTKKCVALIDIDWMNQLNDIKDSIVFIDEGSEYVRTEKFAGAVKIRIIIMLFLIERIFTNYHIVLKKFMK